MLIELEKVRYWDTREEAFLVGLPVGFIMPEVSSLIVLFYHGYIERIALPQESKTIRKLEARDRRVPFGRPQAIQRTPQGQLAILFYELGEEPAKSCCPHVALYSMKGKRDGKFFRSIKFGWRRQMPESNSIIATEDEHFILAYNGDPITSDPVNLEGGQPLFSLYDRNGQFLRSCGIEKSSGFKRGEFPFLFVRHGNGDYFIVYRFPYRFLRYNSSFSLISDQTFEPAFTVQWPTHDLATYFSLVKDVVVGSTYLAVLIANKAQELFTRVGSRIEIFDLRGNLLETHSLDFPGAFIQIDAEDNLWVLHEPAAILFGDVPEYPYLGKYGLG